MNNAQLEHTFSGCPNKDIGGSPTLHRSRSKGYSAFVDSFLWLSVGNDSISYSVATSGFRPLFNLFFGKGFPLNNQKRMPFFPHGHWAFEVILSCSRKMSAVKLSCSHLLVFLCWASIFSDPKGEPCIFRSLGK